MSVNKKMPLRRLKSKSNEITDAIQATGINPITGRPVASIPPSQAGAMSTRRIRSSATGPSDDYFRGVRKRVLKGN